MAVKLDESIFHGIRKFVAPEHLIGENSRLLAAHYCKKLGVRKLFLATDEKIKNTQWFNEQIELLQEEGIDYIIYTSISPNPRDFEVMEGSRLYIDNRCNMIMAIGGGSVIDCAKGIGIVSTNGQHISSFEGVDKIEEPMPPLISIPTTGGSSADVSQFAIINNTVEKYKMAIISKALISDIALIDPVVLTSMDKMLTASTGIDALSHAFEAYVSNASSPVTDLLALEAIHLIDKYLENTVKDPENLKARNKIMLASLYAGLAFSNASLGCVHSLAHSLGGYMDLSHGECNAILLPHVINYNFGAAGMKYRKIAERLGININDMEMEEVKDELIRYLKELNQKLGITATLAHRGVSSDEIKVLAEKAIKDPCNATNPVRPVVEDLELIYKEAL
ncbi:MAG: alcohol dehydrogenase-like regulatory protein ErcA [Bacteroidota bacterium]